MIHVANGSQCVDTHNYIICIYKRYTPPTGPLTVGKWKTVNGLVGGVYLWATIPSSSKRRGGNARLGWPQDALVVDFVHQPSFRHLCGSVMSLLRYLELIMPFFVITGRLEMSCNHYILFTSFPLCLFVSPSIVLFMWTWIVMCISDLPVDTTQRIYQE